MMFRREVVVPVLAKYPDARMRLLEHSRQRLLALNEAINACKTSFNGKTVGDISETALAASPDATFNGKIPPADAHFFAASSLFQDCHLDVLRDLCVSFESKYFDAGVTVFREGDLYH